MAGHVPRRLLKQPEIDKCLVAGTKLWKWEEGDTSLMKLVFSVDKQGFFLYARGDDRGKCYDSFIWDFSQISDVRTGRPPKDSKLVGPLSKPGSDDSIDNFCLTLVIRREGIVNLDHVNLIAESPATADRFKKAVNALTANMLNAHPSPSVFLRKHYMKIRLHANGRGEILLKDMNRLMMIRYAADNFINQWLGTFNIVRDSVDGNTKYIKEDDFTEDIFLKMFDQILNNRVQDLDVMFGLMKTKSQRSKGQLTLADFHKFLNTDQRDPRLNEILHPYQSKDDASRLISRHEKGRRGDRLTSKGLLEYLLSEDNNVLDMDHLNQTHDMTQPITHYFINSSHNTYLTGHQLKSTSTVEMYIQSLLLGCRCLELDCWPENDDIVITHGGTLCTKIYFKDVVEAIDEFAFVTSEYPLILSIENHCKSKPRLIERMATIFKITFGDKLVCEPFEDYPLLESVPLPSPEKLKRRILLKDKIKRGKGGSGDFGTLPRGGVTVPATLDEVPEEQEEGHTSQNSNGSEVTVQPAITVPQTEAANDDTKTEEKDSEQEVNEITTEVDEKSREEKVKAEESTDGEVKESSDEGVKSEDDSGEKEVEQSKAESDSAVKDEEVFQSANGESPKPKPSSGQRTIVRGQASFDGSVDLTEINVSLVPRPSEVEALVGASPLRELLNYCTGISFEGFLAAEKMNCSFYQSSFVEEKGLNYIRTQPKDFVKYNMRQMSRIYPQGTRISSSNYMPQVYWNVGCQLVALNFQTPDLPVQLNAAKFEFNGNTGVLLKPWVMRRERAQGGVFNPFVQSRIEDIVPAKISIKIISGYFLTDRRGANCYAEAGMYGLPADTVLHKYYTKKLPAPHPHWNEATFTFKRILLPELALLRVAVYNDDHELIGQRSLPVNALRPGFRHLPLRDKHNVPLPLAMLFVHIKVEDWVPDEMEDIVSMLMDPISYATMALKAMTEGLEEGNTDPPSESADGTGRAGPVVSIPGLPPISGDSPSQGSPKVTTPIRNPSLDNVKKFSGSGADLLGLGIPTQLPTSGSSQSLRRDLPAAQLPGSFDDTIPCVENAKKRPLPPVTTHDSKAILEHSDYRKVFQKATKKKSSLVKKHEKSVKSLKEKVGKGKATEETLKVLEGQNKRELSELNRKTSTELYEKKRSLLENAHRQQLESLQKKTHKSDLELVKSDLLDTIRKHRKMSETSGAIRPKDSMKDLEDKAIQLGKKARNELEAVHQREVSKMEDMHKESIQELIKTQAKELSDLDADGEGIIF